jgi:hypothetical protein
METTVGSELDFGRLIAAALKTELGATHQAIKTVMRWTGASERTVKHWFAGTYRPRGEHLIALARHSDKVLDAFLIVADRGPIVLGVQLVALRTALIDTVELIDANFGASR